LQEPANATQSFSSSKDPTVWRAIPVLEFLQQSWQNMAANDKFSSVADALHAGLENLGKWSRKTDETDVYFICLGPSPYTILSLTNTYVEQLLILTINSSMHDRNGTLMPLMKARKNSKP
jgi:hypothetical protein